jgi:hypothetical protein
MEAIVELSWRIYPAYALLATGAALAAYGLTVQYRGIVKPIRDPDKNLTWMRGFRLTVVGLAVAGIAAAWAWQSVFLLVLALLIGGGETFESSLDIFALRRGRRMQEEQDARKRRETAAQT